MENTAWHEPLLYLRIENSYCARNELTGGWVLQAWIDVNLNADLRNVFSWNTKQVYVFLMVEFTTKKNHLNQAVLWNRIIERKVGNLFVHR